MLRLSFFLVSSLVLVAARIALVDPDVDVDDVISDNTLETVKRNDGVFDATALVS